MKKLLFCCWLTMAILVGAFWPSIVSAQGGETCATATVIAALPYCDSGTTVGHVNDYTPPCVTGVAAPDVVYSYTPAVTQVISVSLCFSAYNTVLHVWRGCPGGGGVIFCCSDNFCSLQSCCPSLTVGAGLTYYFIVDGSTVGGGLASGAYIINVVAGPQCPTIQCNPNVCPYPDLDVDPANNTCTGFTPVLSCEDTLCGEINPTNDLDFYSIDIPPPYCVILTLDVYADDTPGWWPFGGGLNPKVRLVGIDCATVLGMDDDGGTGTDAHLVSFCLEPGRYKILVENSSLTQPAGPYILRTSCQVCECPPDTCPYPNRDIESGNNICDSSNPQMQCGDTLCGVVEANTSGDYYLLQIPTPGCYLVKLDLFGNDTPGWWPAGQGLDPIVSVYDVSCTTFLGTDDNGGTGNDAHLELCLPAGLYHVFVHDPVGLPGGPYILASYCEPCECPVDTCPYPSLDFDPGNDICSANNPLFSCNDTLCGEIINIGDEDWYCVQLYNTPCTQITIDIFGNDTPGWWPFGQGLNPVVSLWSDCGTQIGFDDNGGTGNDSRLVSGCLPPGVYRIRVYNTGAVVPTMGPYILATACIPCVCPQDTCPYPSRDFESINNTCETFNPQVTCDDTLCGDIRPAGDQDWYLLQIPLPCAVVTIDVFGDDTPGFWPFGQGLNPKVTLVSLDCGTLIQVDLNSGVGEDPRLVTTCIPGGLYHILVEGEGAAVPSVGPYILAVHCATCNCEPCDIDCIVGDTPEGEPCPNYPDFFNSGCDGPNPGAMRPIQCGQTICGHLQADSSRYDRDWYVLRTLESDTLMWCVWSEYPIRTYVIAAGPGGNPCIGSDTLACGRTTGTCDTVCLGACVPPGTYLFKIEPNLAAPPYPDIPCSTTYRSRLLCTICSPPLPGTPDSVVIHYPTVASNNINLHWPPVTGAEGYNIYRSTNSETVPGPATYVATTLDTFYVDPGIIGAVDERNFYLIKAIERVNGCR